MKAVKDHVVKAQVALQDAIHELRICKEPTPTIVDVSLTRWVVTAGSGGCRVRGTYPPGDVFLQEGDLYAMHHSYTIEPSETDENENLVALRTSLSECIKQRDEREQQVAQQREEILACHTQIVNLREFSDNQRKQLESLQKEMAAIHMVVTADSRTKLDDAISMHGREMPFLLKTVYEAMDRYFDTKAAAEQRISMINAAREELT